MIAGMTVLSVSTGIVAFGLLGWFLWALPRPERYRSREEMEKEGWHWASIDPDDPGGDGRWIPPRDHQ